MNVLGEDLKQNLLEIKTQRSLKNPHWGGYSQPRDQKVKRVLNSCPEFTSMGFHVAFQVFLLPDLSQPVSDLQCGELGWDVGALPPPHPLGSLVPWGAKQGRFAKSEALRLCLLPENSSQHSLHSPTSHLCSLDSCCGPEVCYFVWLFL